MVAPSRSHANGRDDLTSITHMTTPDVFIHPTAEVEQGAILGEGTRVWGHAHVRSGARLGTGCIVGRNAYIDSGVSVGANCKVQNNALVYAPATLADGVFIGPGAVITNDVNPRAVTPNETLKAATDWDSPGIHIGTGSAVGANATIVAGVTIGCWALIAAGAVVVGDVADHALVVGVPARHVGWVGHQGFRLIAESDGLWRCPVDGTIYREASTGLKRQG